MAPPQRRLESLLEATDGGGVAVEDIRASRDASGLVARYEVVMILSLWHLVSGTPGPLDVWVMGHWDGSFHVCLMNHLVPGSSVPYKQLIPGTIGPYMIMKFFVH